MEIDIPIPHRKGSVRIADTPGGAAPSTNKVTTRSPKTDVKTGLLWAVNKSKIRICKYNATNCLAVEPDLSSSRYYTDSYLGLLFS